MGQGRKRAGEAAVGRGRLIALVFVALMVVSQGAAAAPKIHCKDDPASQYPGLKLGDVYPAVKRLVPRKAGCASTTADSCEFIDRYGVLNHFSDARRSGHGGWERELFLRIQDRSRGGWLPYGVNWSDGYAEVFRRLKSHGGKSTPSDPDIISVTLCDLPQSDEAYGFNFKFDKAGRLSTVEQSYQAY